MDIISKIEDLPFVDSFKRKLRKKDYKSSKDMMHETAQIFRDVIYYTLENHNITKGSDLIELIRHLGKIFIQADPMQFSVGNIVKRILNIIRVELKEKPIKVTSNLPRKRSEFRVRRIMSMRSLRTLIDIKSYNKPFFSNSKEGHLKIQSESSKKEINDYSEAYKDNYEATEFDNDTSESTKKSNKKKKNAEKSYVDKNNKFDNYDDDYDDDDEDEDKLSFGYDDGMNETIKELVNNILNNLDELITEIETINETIESQACTYIKEGDVILTANRNDQLSGFFCEAAKTKKFRIFITESAPSLNGIVQAKSLASKGLNVTVINDTDVFAIMPKITKVFIGTRAIMNNGDLISYNGVYNVCLCAQKFSVPVIVISSIFKLTPLYVFGHEKFNEFLSPCLIYGKDVKYNGDIRNIKFNNPAYDYVPPELITLYITSHGVQNPAYIYRFFAELYSQEDYDL